jgi:GTPase SAR1 family protein
MRDLYIKNGDTFLVLFSLVSTYTLHDLPAIRDQILRVKDKETVPMVIVGNKCDLVEKRAIPAEEGHALGVKCGCPYIETSAKLNLNVELVFMEAVRQALAVLTHPPPRSRNGCVLS